MIIEIWEHLSGHRNNQVVCIILLYLHLYSRFAFTVALALRTDIVAQHSTKDKILLRRKLIQRSGNDEFDGLHTLPTPEIHVHVLPANRLKYIRNTLTLQPLYGLITILFITGKEHHAAHPLLQLVDMVHQHLQCSPGLFALCSTQSTSLLPFHF